MKRILINSSYGDELRVALVDGAKLYDFDTESPDKVLLKGSIFKATVSRIESSLDAAFINFGSERHGFLRRGAEHQGAAGDVRERVRRHRAAPAVTKQPRVFIRFVALITT